MLKRQLASSQNEEGIFYCLLNEYHIIQNSHTRKQCAIFSGWWNARFLSIIIMLSSFYFIGGENLITDVNMPTSSIEGTNFSHAVVYNVLSNQVVPPSAYFRGQHRHYVHLFMRWLHSNEISFTRKKKNIKKMMKNKQKNEKKRRLRVDAAEFQILRGVSLSGQPTSWRRAKIKKRGHSRSYLTLPADGISVFWFGNKRTRHTTMRCKHSFALIGK